MSYEVIREALDNYLPQIVLIYYLRIFVLNYYKGIGGYSVKKFFWQYERNNLQEGIDTRIFTARHDRKLRCVLSGPTVGQNAPGEEWHLSLSHPDREPTPEGIDSAINAHVPAQIPMSYWKDAVLKTINNAKPALHFHEATEDSSYGVPYLRRITQD